MIWNAEIGSYFGAQCVKRGMFVRVTGDNISMAPPFIITEGEVDEVNQGTMPQSTFKN